MSPEAEHSGSHRAQGGAGTSTPAGGEARETTLIVGYIITLLDALFPPSYEICSTLLAAQRVRINVNASDLTVIMKSRTVIARV